MILTLDVGNTQISGGVFEGEKLVLQFRLTNRAGNTSDELGMILRSMLRENGVDWQKIERIGVCSVVPSINYSLASAFSKYFNQTGLFIQAGVKTGLKLKFANPKEIGADRIATAVGAMSEHPESDLIIIDMGTAISVDVVTAGKEYAGGSILPGIKMGVEALARGTAKLPEVEIAKPVHCIGTSTIEAIQSGTFYGTLGGVKEIINQYKKSLFKDRNPVVIGTGAFVRIFEKEGLFDFTCQELSLVGIKKVLEIN